MAIPLFLAMTGAEFDAGMPLPAHTAWLACHFSAHDRGLTGLPPALPEGSLLILDDRISMAGHDPVIITRQLRQAVEDLGCSGLVLDLQRPGMPEAAGLAADLTAALPCPVAVSDLYAKPLDCPVFLSPCPHHIPLSEHLLPWKGRQIWLDLAVDAESILLTKDGAAILPFPPGEVPQNEHQDASLHCHYWMETGENFVRFTLWRTKEDRKVLSLEAERLGITGLVGLYSELSDQYSI